MKVLRAHDVLPQAAAPVNDPLRLMTVPEVARELRCSKAHLFNVIHSKVAGLPPLPVLNIGRRVLIRREALLRWMELLEGHDEDIEFIAGA